MNDSKQISRGRRKGTASVGDTNKDRCIVLIGEGKGGPKELLSGLAKRGVFVRLVADAVGVMAELGSGGGGAVIVAQPGGQKRLSELLGAVRQYYPKVGCWGYESGEGGGKAKLSKLGDVVGVDAQLIKDRSSWGRGQEAGLPDVKVEEKGELDHVVKLVKPGLPQNGGGQEGGVQGKKKSEPDAAVEGIELNVQPLLCEDELEMLLGPGLDEESDGGD